MTGEVSDWLPLGVVTRAPVREVIAAAVDDWSGAWFAGRRLGASAFTATRADNRSDDDGAGWRVHRKALAVSCSRRAGARLRDWALDAGGGPAPSPVDQQLLAAFERRLLGDLAARVERALGLDGPPAAAPPPVANPYGPHGGLAVEIADEHGDRLVSLAAPLAALSAACRASLGPRSRTARLQGLRAALGDTKVSIGAILGAAQIALPDLHSLAPGDVLVLDTALQDTAALTLAGSDTVFARAKLAERDGDMTLTLHA